MEHESPAFNPEHVQACAKYDELRTMERARLNEWRDELRAAADLVYGLHDDLAKYRPEYAPFPAAAAQENVFRPERIRDIDRKLLTLLAGETEVREARIMFACSNEPDAPEYDPDPLPRRWSDMFTWTMGPDFTVGTLRATELERLGDLLSSLVDACWSCELFTLSRLRGDERPGQDGRPKSAAARFMAEWCRENRQSMTRMARLVIEAGIEQPDVGDSGADPVKRLADRWRKK